MEGQGVRERIAVRPGGSIGIAASERATPSVINWTARYLRQAVVVDVAAALIAGIFAMRSRNGSSCGRGGRYYFFCREYISRMEYYK